MTLRPAELARVRLAQAVVTGVSMLVALTSCSDPIAPAFDGGGGDSALGVDPSPQFADEIVAAPSATGGGFFDPQRAINGVRGGGVDSGSLDVFSLQNEEGKAFLTLRWRGRAVANGPGPEVVVFENAFVVSSSPDVYFMDLTVVEVSRDGAQWRAFPHDYLAVDETNYSPDPAEWHGFAGKTPTQFHAEDNPVDPFARAAAGGDAFDLDALDASDAESQALQADGFVFIRLTSAATRTNPDTGLPYPHAAISDGPDIDGVVARYLKPAVEADGS